MLPNLLQTNKNMLKPNLYIRTLLVVAIMAGLGSCLVGPKYSEPAAIRQYTYRDSSTAYDTSALAPWFEVYKDPALQQLIKRTLDSNRNLLIAATRIEEAQAQTAAIKANMWPKLGYNASAGGGRAGTDATKVGGGLNSGALKVIGVLDWELDLWGRLRHSNQAAIAQLLGVTENRNALQASLVAEVASLYFLLRDLDNRIEITKRTLAIRKESTRIITARFDTGYIAELDKLQAIQQQALAAASIPNFERQITQVENALRNLTGMGPGRIERGLTNDEQNIPDIPVGIPSQLLRRRPDIRAGEYQLKAQLEQIGIAQANMYPRISLTGLLGFASPQLGTLLGNKGFVANGFAGLSGPVFAYGQNRSLVGVQRKRYDQAVYSYEQTILDAFSDVDNSLTFYRTYREEHDQVKILVDAARKAYQLTKARYDYGYSSYLEVIIQETNLFEAQMQESFTRQQTLASVVKLYRAMGGGW